MASNYLARTDLSYYIESTSHGLWQPAPHLDLLCHKLEAIERGEIKRLIVTMPPRHGKSEVISKSFPSWYLGKHPDREIILTSYGADLANDNSRICRGRFKEFNKDIFGVEISADSAAVDRWGIKGHRGGVTAAGVGGPITGRGASIAIVDDPVKTMKEARSPTIRESIKEWYRTALRTRLAPGGAIIIVMTRWHQDDLVGYLLKEMAEDLGEQWEVLNLPAIAEEDDALGRTPGDPLWPEKFPLKELLATQKSQTQYEWNALYQQHPSDPEGNLFKREFFRYYTKTGDVYILHTPEGDKRYNKQFLTIFQTCDPAGSTKSSADYFVLATWGATRDGNLLLLDCYRTKIEGPDHLSLIVSAFSKWRPKQIGIEEANLGKTSFQTAQRRGLPVIPLQPDGDKYTRALPIAARYQNGTVYHPDNEVWTEDYEEELVAFPTGANDDQVDNAAYAGIMLPKIKTGPKVKSPNDIL